MTQEVPKIAHISWVNKNILESQNPIVLNGVSNLIDLNPDWNVIFYDDNDIDSYLRSNLSKSDYDLIADKHTVEKSDTWRLLKMFNEGGLYMDVDRYCNKKMSDIIPLGVKWILPTCGDLDFSHDVMLSAPYNPVFDMALKLVLQRRRQGINNTYYLGPQTYMHAITLVLFDCMVDPDPGVSNMTEIRRQIDKLDFVKTYRETMPLSTLLFEYKAECFKQGNSKSSDWETQKRELYAECGLRHWTGEW